jgi:uracil-DNA glycosylase family 4
MTTEPSKSRLLGTLREEIFSTISNPWLFPTRDSVKGFMGTGPVMFVGERPSTGNFGGTADRLLYSLLERYNAANAHLTDVIKSRGKVGEPYPEDIAPHRRIFDREIEIIKPRLIITFGQKVYDLLQFSLAGSGIKVRQVWHYSYTRRGPDKAVTFEGQIQQVLAS